MALLLGGIMVLMLSGLPVAFAFLVLNLAGAWYFLGGEAGLQQLVRNGVLGVSSFSLVPIPLFIFMGDMLFQSGLAMRAINAIDRLIARVPGRMPVVVIVAGTVFSAISGSTIATTAILGTLMLPEMLKRGYDSKLAMGSIMGIGAVDMLIPPSALTVLLGSLALIPISDLLIAGVIPGLVMALLFVSYIIGTCIIYPEKGPIESPPEMTMWERWLPLFRDVLPLLSIFAAVVISMTSGWATPTEAAAVGAVATILIAMAYGSFKIAGFVAALKSTASVTGAILLIIMGATTFAQILSFSGATQGLVGTVTAMVDNRWIILGGMILVLLILGCFIDSVSIMLITLPFFMPLIGQLGFDKVWFGIVFLICMQFGLLSPPFGLLLFTMRSVAPASVPTKDIFAAIMPYLVMLLLMVLVIIVFPGMVTWLPEALRD